MQLGAHYCVTQLAAQRCYIVQNRHVRLSEDMTARRDEEDALRRVQFERGQRRLQETSLDRQRIVTDHSRENLFERLGEQVMRKLPQEHAVRGVPATESGYTHVRSEPPQYELRLAHCALDRHLQRDFDFHTRQCTGVERLFERL